MLQLEQTLSRVRQHGPSWVNSLPAEGPLRAQQSLLTATNSVGAEVWDLDCRRYPCIYLVKLSSSEDLEPLQSQIPGQNNSSQVWRSSDGALVTGGPIHVQTLTPDEQRDVEARKEELYERFREGG